MILELTITTFFLFLPSLPIILSPFLPTSLPFFLLSLLLSSFFHYLWYAFLSVPSKSSYLGMYLVIALLFYFYLFWKWSSNKSDKCLINCIGQMVMLSLYQSLLFFVLFYILGMILIFSLFLNELSLTSHTLTPFHNLGSKILILYSTCNYF